MRLQVRIGAPLRGAQTPWTAYTGEPRRTSICRASSSCAAFAAASSAARAPTSESYSRMAASQSPSAQRRALRAPAAEARESSRRAARSRRAASSWGRGARGGLGRSNARPGRGGRSRRSGGGRARKRRRHALMHWHAGRRAQCLAAVDRLSGLDAIAPQQPRPRAAPEMHLHWRPPRRQLQTRRRQW